jgi:flagellar motility protein MotE (MotC chaperone)
MLCAGQRSSAQMDEDLDKALSEIRKRGDQLLDDFTDLLLNDSDRKAVEKALREMKEKQDDIATILEKARRK